MSPSIRMQSVLLVFVTLLLSACTTAPRRPATGVFIERSLAMDGVGRRYQVFVPSAAAAGTRAPVVLFLHGSGERGSDGVKPTMAGLGPHLRAHAQAFPAIVVFPQAADESEWAGDNLRMAMAMLEAATREFGGDPSRTILTGMSMGGYGTWELALQFPRRFAALVPVCGAVRQLREERPLLVTEVARDADPYATIARRLRDVPVWMFHGAKDDVVPPEDDRRLAAAFKAAGAADARYTELPDANHNAWDPTYAMPELWAWAWAQRSQ